jgi:hypothetical protein
MTRGSFPVCARNMNRSETVMGITYSFANFYGIGNVFPDSRCANPAEHRKFRVKIFERLLVGQVRLTFEV